ncbi:MAG: hypothetical protein E6Q50_05265 [Lysobacter sp.]|nr:MAG: hypothetical protein E6Q50_05265 [Lysobacter sp.]
MTSVRDFPLMLRRLRLRPYAPWLAALLAVAALTSVLFRDRIADALWPEARAEALRQQASAALAAGRLTAADGSGARELYEAGMAIDPDRAELRAGLAAVALAAATRAGRAVDQGRFVEAHRDLALARELSAPRALTDAVAERLREREAAVAGIDTWLAQADRARQAGRLHGEADAALPLYRRILDLQPQHLRALEGREDALSDWLRRAHDDLRRGDVIAAAAKIAIAADYDHGHVELPEAQSALALAAERARRRADADLRAGRLERAAEGFRQWRAGGSEIAAADDALARVAQAHVQRARAAAADFRFDAAARELDASQALVGETAELRDLRRDIERKARTHPIKTPTAADLRRARRLLNEAEAAEARGDWLTPPGDSAYDKLRAARALAPDDPAVARAMRRLLPKARACFEQHLRDNSLQRARVCMDAHVALGGDARTATQARRALAMRWLAVGDERLSRGELDGAQAALDAARGLDAKTPGIGEFAERVRAAGATTQTP